MTAFLCEHADSDVEYIAQQEYPGGGVKWCSRCGSWRDDDEVEWHIPKLLTPAFLQQIGDALVSGGVEIVSTVDVGNGAGIVVEEVPLFTKEKL